MVRKTLTAAPILWALLFCVCSPLPAQTSADGQRENWSSIYLTGQPLVATPPLLGETDNQATFTRQIIELNWRKGDPIYLYVLLPKLAPKPPVIVYINNYATDTDLFLDNKYCKLLTTGGFAAVGFASALSGQRYHDRPMLQWFVSELPESLGETVHDLQMVLNYLATRGDLDMQRIGIEGDGSGGAIAVLSAAADPRVRVIDLLDPWGDWPAWLAKSTVVPDEERPKFITPSFLSTVSPLDPVKWLPGLKIPIRLQYLRKNGATPDASQERIKASCPPQAVFVPQEQALAEYQASKGEAFFDWIKQQLLTR